MTQAAFLKNLPVPLQFWVRPMLLASLGLHGLFLAIPMHSEHKPAPLKKEPDKVKITQLPTKTNSPAPKISPLATPKPAAIVPPTKLAPQPNPIHQSVITPPASPISSISRPQPQLTASTTPAPTATPSTTPTSAQPTQTPSTTTTPTATSSPSPVSQDPFADFPIYPNATPGSSGLLTGDADKAARTVKADLPTVMAYYKTELPNKKFDAKSTTEETDLKVSQVSKGGVSQYLHLKHTGENTIIVLAPQPLDLKNLGNLEVEPPEAREFQTVLGQIVSVDESLPLVPENDLQDSAPFQGGNIKHNLGIFKEVTPQALGSLFEQGLRGAGFEVSPISTNFAGGILYQVKKGYYVGYLSLAPTKTPGRTGILTLKNSPIR